MPPPDLTRRLGVAVLGIPTVVLLLYLGRWALAVPVAVLAALGAREVYALARARGPVAFGILGMVTAAALVLAAEAGGDWRGFASLAVTVLALALLASLVAAVAARGQDAAPLGAVATTLFGAMYAGLALAFAPLLHGLPALRGWGGGVPSPWMGTMVVALPLAAAWVGDAAAYFAGSAWGKHGPKLAPSISPNKSWIGSAFGIVGAAVAAVVWLHVARPFLPEAPLPGPLVVAGAGAVLGVGAQVGDLVESLFKREAGVKDSGTLFPGHGGALDRLDALVVTLPLAYAFLAVAVGAR